MTRSYNLCVVGAGRWGKNHIRTLSELRALGGVVESDTEVLNSLKLTYPEIQYFSDLESALNNEFDEDGISLCGNYKLTDGTLKKC